MNLLHRLGRFFAPNAIHRQLYPPPSLALQFRPYRESDRATVLDLHDQNAPARFPEGHRPTFEKFIDSASANFFVVESGQAGVLACCGITAVGDNVHVLCYGLVARQYQGMRIGATMTLARLCFATRNEDLNYSVIYAVAKSMGYYRRFGYWQSYAWKGEDGKENPVGVLRYDSRALEPISAALEKRGHLIDPSWPLKRDPHQEIIITGHQTLEFQRNVKEPGPPPAPLPEVPKGSA